MNMVNRTAALARPRWGSWRIPILVALALVAAAATIAVWHSPQFDGFFEARHDNIADLKLLPNGRVKFQGVITYADAFRKRIWIQDETGAVSINQDPKPLSLQAGDKVWVEARKTHAYDPLIGLSTIGLKDFTVTLQKRGLPLPLPIETTLRPLPPKDKNGIRVRLNAVVHAVAMDESGLPMIGIGTGGAETWAVLPANATNHLPPIDSTIQVVGPIDSVYDGAGYIQSQRMFTVSTTDLQVLAPPPDSNPLFSVPLIYSHADQPSDHSVRLRGRLVKVSTSDFWSLVEDSTGSIACRFDRAPEFPIGTMVEVTGFPYRDGLRIDLLHSTFKHLDPSAESTPFAEPKSTSIAAIRQLTPQQASTAMPVSITGVVTFLDTDWRQLYLQDSSGGIYVKYAGTNVPLFQGQRLKVIGVTNAGDYAPVVIAPRFVHLGKEPLPAPAPVTISVAYSGTLDSRFVEVEGVVHPLKTGQNPKHLSFDLYSAFGPVHVSTGPGFGGEEHIKELEDASVRIRGVCGTVFNSRRQLVGFQLSVTEPSNIEVLEPADPNPFQKRAVPIDQLLQFSPKARFNHRVKVSGSVTMVGPGFFYIQDRTGGLQIQSDAQGLRNADLVEAVGYATNGGYSPVMTDADVHVLRHNMPGEVQPATMDALADGALDSRLVTVEGRLLNVDDTPAYRTLVLQAGSHTFEARLFRLDATTALPETEEGSIVRITGISSAQVEPGATYLLLAKEAVGFRILVRSPEDILVLRNAPWWNLRHTALVLATLLVFVVAGLVWVQALHRRVRVQNAKLKTAMAKERAISELAAAMQDVTRRQDFTSIVSIQGDEEIARLGTEFNKMIGELRVRDEAKAQAESKLQYQALTDELTGLPNRRLLSDRLTQTLENARRANQIVAILYLDLDGFKLVNDSLGHTTGDVLLGQVAQRLRSRIRRSDTLARIGGDEFTIVLTQLHRKEEAALVCKSLLEALGTPFAIEGHEITIGASIGVSLFPENSSEASDLLQQADSAMYAAKRNGKNRSLYFTPELGSMVRERLNLENQLRGAIARGEIAVHYQPEFDVASGKLVRFEALARWTHPTLGNIPPAKFIPIAEESGLIIPLGSFILERACEEAVGWQKISPDPVQVAVNVSSLQFMRDSFVEELVETLKHTGLKPSLLQIELTESVMLSGTEPAAETMRRLAALGVTIAIDDFGTGYSCFSYLPRLPFNALKIDRAFVKELSARKEMKAMVHSLITLAHNLNMQVVVEGIETQEQLEMIRRVGGNQVQGFLLGRPTPDPQSALLSMVGASSPALDVRNEAARSKNS
jgi:diguanylate cyclase (GGDEF)-like protein